MSTLIFVISEVIDQKEDLKGQKGSPKHTECIFRGLEKKIGQAARGLLEKLNFLKEALDNLHLTPTERFNSKHAPGGGSIYERTLVRYFMEECENDSKTQTEKYVSQKHKGNNEEAADKWNIIYIISNSTM